ncbi:hypothetical protein [Inquilinus limosus]|uniref:hypothetical protein n=1 Tax=Inquilinus limosus TaxID=171674 RepID=UPI001269E4FB|nr:hypothetical protein [Inquilinus limosus]
MTPSEIARRERVKTLELLAQNPELSDETRRDAEVLGGALTLAINQVGEVLGRPLAPGVVALVLRAYAEEAERVIAALREHYNSES